jgi:hypothetical protein
MNAVPMIERCAERQQASRSVFEEFAHANEIAVKCKHDTALLWYRPYAGAVHARVTESSTWWISVKEDIFP